jgi:hypothetical protein
MNLDEMVMIFIAVLVILKGREGSVRSTSVVVNISPIQSPRKYRLDGQLYSPNSTCIQMILDIMPLLQRSSIDAVTTLCPPDKSVNVLSGSLVWTTDASLQTTAGLLEC